jgi:hypothetical protein
MNAPYSIRIFIPEGDPNGLRIISNVNWTGTGVVFPRDKWASALEHGDIKKPGIYILWGYNDDPEDPRIRVYIGEGDYVPHRIESHLEKKDFWAQAIVFTSDSLNKAYIRYIESMLVARARKYNRCIVENGTDPAKPPMSASDCADAEAFLRQILQILPLVDISVFDEPKITYIKKDNQDSASTTPEQKSKPTDTDELVMVVPCRDWGFNKAFIGENSWYYVRISAGKIDRIKWCAAYQVAPVSAITHIAPVDRIVQFGEQGQYKLIFSSPAVKLDHPIPLGAIKSGAMQGPRYTTLSKLKSAKDFSDLG